MSAYDTTTFLANVRRRAFAPSSAATGTQDADLLALADDEIMYTLLPELLAVREEYYVALQSTVIGSTQSFPIPYRAIGPKIRKAFRADTSGNVVSLDEMRIEDLARYGPQPGSAAAFYLQGDNVVIFPPPPTTSTGDSLQLYYHVRPSRLQPVASCGAISSIDTGAKTVTISGSPPAGFTTGIPYDFVKGTPNFTLYALDQACTGVAGSVFSFAALPANLAVGDYLCLPEQTPVPMVPREFHPVLAQLTANQVLRNLGNLPKLQAGEAEAGRLMEKCLVLLTQRAEGEVEVLVSDAFYPNSLLAW